MMSLALSTLARPEERGGIENSFEGGKLHVGCDVPAGRSGCAVIRA
jgi:hypothetical protein